MIWQHSIPWLMPPHIENKDPTDLEYLQHLDYEPEPGNAAEQMKAALGNGGSGIDCDGADAE